MRQSILDPCFFYKTTQNGLKGMEATLVDGTSGAGNDEFSQVEMTTSKKFDVKERESKFPIRFRGLDLLRSSDCLLVSQNYQLLTLKSLKVSEVNPRLFAQRRGQLTYVASATRPDIAYLCAKLSQVKAEQATKEDSLLLNYAVKNCRKRPRSLKVPKLDLNSLYICGYAAWTIVQFVI